MQDTYQPLHESETLSFWKSESMQARKKRMDFMSHQIKALVALKMQKQDNVPSEIAPGLFLGSIGAALSKEQLKEDGITHILTAADKIKPAHPSDFTYKCVALLDCPTQDIQTHFNDSVQFIQESLDSKGKVLVHCFAGKSRSCTLLAAYLMKTMKLTVTQALQMIRKKRPIVQPNVGFMRQLRSYEKNLVQQGVIILPEDSDEEA